MRKDEPNIVTKQLGTQNVETNNRTTQNDEQHERYVHYNVVYRSITFGRFKSSNFRWTGIE
jgi:hypothetical protein